MLKNTAVLLFLLGLLMPHAAVAQVVLDETNSQRIEADDFAIRIPAEWSRQSDPKSVLTLLSPVPSPWIFFRDNIRITKHPLKKVADVDVIRTLQERELDSDFSVLGSGILGDTKLRMAWLAISKKEVPAGEQALAKVDYLIISGSDLFALHAMCEARHLEKRRPLFDAIARTIELPSPQLAPLPVNENPRLVPLAVNTDARDVEKSQAYEDGRLVGWYASRVMLAVIVVWGLMRFLRRGKSLVSS